MEEARAPRRSLPTFHTNMQDPTVTWRGLSILVMWKVGQKDERLWGVRSERASHPKETKCCVKASLERAFTAFVVSDMGWLALALAPPSFKETFM